MVYHGSSPAPSPWPPMGLRDTIDGPKEKKQVGELVSIISTT
ncbi:hypothetical protein DKAM_0454 [Desulfurococcus amylolyticus 1221n]|uniref:Uncharacterized protein n=1 Tax=Desulfurococcus amylolyticus (strain DSM 18924 / JCM 16383 / VKM B-2413 / 1221n) TaxID=490899 RepID=B8D3U9_DESA1|nr:hypothetical protein DKAM_0454 [Desulfurococcus amylolyticus 1221n]